MLEPKSDPTKRDKLNGDNVTTRVNVAFPFSQLRIQEPSDELRELAAVVRGLADLVAEVAPGPTANDLGERARALAARLK